MNDVTPGRDSMRLFAPSVATGRSIPSTARQRVGRPSAVASGIRATQLYTAMDTLRRLLNRLRGVKTAGGRCCE